MNENENEDEVVVHLKGRTLEEGEWGDIVVIRPNGEFVLHTCDPTIENMQALVGGWVEVVPYFKSIYKRPCLVLCDEEGKMKRRPVNTRATLEWQKSYPHIAGYDMLVGDVVVLTGKAKKEFER